MKTPSNRLMRRVYSWDQHLNNTGQIISWSSEVKSILYDANLHHIHNAQQMFPIKEIVKQLNTTFLIFNKNGWQLNAEINPN